MSQKPTPKRAVRMQALSPEELLPIPEQEDFGPNDAPPSPVAMGGHGKAKMGSQAGTANPSDNRWIFAGVFALLLAMCALLFAWKYRARVGELVGQPPMTQASPTPSPTPTPEPGLTLLLMGRGGAGHEGGALADTIVLARILETQRRVVLLSIPRDLWVRIPYDGAEGINAKINYAYALGITKNAPTSAIAQGKTGEEWKAEPYRGVYGGGELAKKVVEDVTGVKVDKYVTIDFSGFEQAIDTVGGVELSVERAFTDYEYPIAGRESLDCTTYTPVPLDPAPLALSEADLISAGKLDTNTLSGLPKEYPCRYEMLQFQAGKQQMDGKRALKYVRSRHSAEDGNDFSRSRRQKLVMEAVVTKLFSLNAVTKIPTFLSMLRAHIDTDLATTEILALLPKANDYRSFPITSLTLSMDNYLGQGYTADRQFALTPLTGEGKYSAIQNWVQNAIDPTQPLLYPTIEVIGNWRNSSASATLKDTFNGAGYPTRLGQLVMKDATTSATLTWTNTAIDTPVIKKIQAIAGVTDVYVRQASPSAKSPARTDITILLP